MGEKWVEATTEMDTAFASRSAAIRESVMEMWEDLMVHSDDEEDQAAAPMAFL